MKITDDRELEPSFVHKYKLPPMFPTPRHFPEFWEQLGRTVSTFGFLEEILGRAIFAFTATRRYEPAEMEAAYQKWLPTLERALTDPLCKLAEAYGKAAGNHPAMKDNGLDQIVEKIKDAAFIRNALCHGSWDSPDSDGKSRPRFVNKRGRVFDTRVDISVLRQVQAHATELACVVINGVTLMGWQFPGSGGPGKPEWSPQ